MGSAIKDKVLKKTVIFFTPFLNPIETMSFPSSNNNEHIGKSRKRKPTCEADCLLIQQRNFTTDTLYQVDKNIALGDRRDRRAFKCQVLQNHV